MDALELRSLEDCRWDCVSLGEVMLRLDPGEGRIHTARRFDVWEGGGEYNVARGLRRCFGLRTAIATALVENSVGRLLEDLILQGGVDTSLIRWTEEDGIGREVRNGLNFVERGFGVRSAVGCSDRGNSATSQLKPGDFDFELVFGRQGTRWLHTGGIFAGLSESTAAVAAEAMDAARRNGAVVSYDFNYRESLWRSIGGISKAREVNRTLAKKADVLFGNVKDFSAMLGVEFAGTQESLYEAPEKHYAELLRAVVQAYPHVKMIATSLRQVHSATRNAWGGIGIYRGEVVHIPMREVEILDRVGGGDSFASGVIYGLLSGLGLEWTMRCGVAHGALAMTTPGDTSMATITDVERVMLGEAAVIAR